MNVGMDHKQFNKNLTNWTISGVVLKTSREQDDL